MSLQKGDQDTTLFYHFYASSFPLLPVFELSLAKQSLDISDKLYRVLVSF